MTRKKTVVQIYKSRGAWRWRMTDFLNRKIIAASSEGYRRRIDAVKNLRRVASAICDV